MDEQQPFTFDQLLEGLGPIIFESIRIPFGIFDSRHRVLWANDALSGFHGLSSQELIGNVCHQVVHNNPTPCPDCPIERVCQTGQLHIEERWYQLPDGKKVWGEVHNYPIRARDGNIAAVITFGFDVTNRKNREEVLSTYSKYLSFQLSTRKQESKSSRSDDHPVAIAVSFSARENEVLRLVTKGYTNVQIATLLSISTNTVKTHMNNIFNKLGVNDRTQAAVYATRHHIVD